MSFDFGAYNNYGPLKLVAVRHPREAFASDARLDAEWQKLNYHARPDLANARAEFDRALAIIKATGATVVELPDDPSLTMDSLYTHDALVVTPQGLVRPRMGKPERRGEPAINGAALANLGLPVAGDITGDGKLEGGDLV